MPFTVTVFFHFNDTDTVSRLFFFDIVGQTFAIAIINQSIGMDGGINVFMIDHHQATIIVVGKGKKVHAIMVITSLFQLFLPGITGIGFPFCCSCFHRITPGEEGFCLIAIRDHDFIK